MKLLSVGEAPPLFELEKLEAGSAPVAEKPPGRILAVSPDGQTCLTRQEMELRPEFTLWVRLQDGQWFGRMVFGWDYACEQQVPEIREVRETGGGRVLVVNPRWARREWEDTVRWWQHPLPLITGSALLGSDVSSGIRYGVFDTPTGRSKRLFDAVDYKSAVSKALEIRARFFSIAEEARRAQERILRGEEV